MWAGAVYVTASGVVSRKRSSWLLLSNITTSYLKNEEYLNVEGPQNEKWWLNRHITLTYFLQNYITDILGEG